MLISVLVNVMFRPSKCRVLSASHWDCSFLKVFSPLIVDDLQSLINRLIETDKNSIRDI